MFERFIIDDAGTLIDIQTRNTYDYVSDLWSLMNELCNERQELETILKIYCKIANCRNCDYHDYDWFDEGDEFEVCLKGNNMDNNICEDWREL